MRESIFGSLYGEPNTIAIFSDEQLVINMLRVEAALAQVQAGRGIISQEVANEINVCIDEFQPKFDDLRAGTEQSGFPMIALLEQVREQLSDAAADYLHWGATTQDIIDTATILQVRSALAHTDEILAGVIYLLAELAKTHKDTIMAGRTHSQQALPITFGYKVVTWLAPLLRHGQRLAEIKSRVLALQFGGAAGTLAALGGDALAIRQELATALDLPLPEIPWHTQRDRITEMASWLSLLSGSLGKIAQDIILMAQSEVGELRESGDGVSGGSSTMPQKNNPIISEYIVAAARSNAALLSTMHQTQLQEHERGTHGWQLELLNFPQMFILTNGTLKNTHHVLKHLHVNTARMQGNVRASNGLMLAEAISFALTAHMSRAEAKGIVRAACKVTQQSGQHLVDVVRDKTDADLEWDTLRDEANYLGACTVFVDTILEKVEASL